MDLRIPTPTLDASLLSRYKPRYNDVDDNDDGGTRRRRRGMQQASQETFLSLSRPKRRRKLIVPVSLPLFP